MSGVEGAGAGPTPCPDDVVVGDTVVGLVLAAGAGRRFGGPKVLVPGWLADRCAALRDGGCDRVLVVLGAAADDARALVPGDVAVVVAPDWEAGLSASLRAGLRAAARGDARAVVVVPVDTPGLTAAAVAKVVVAAGEGDRAAADALVQATYDGVPGHPVLLGRAHWDAVVAQGAGDSGARGYLARRAVVRVPCEDVAVGRDVDEDGPAVDA